VIDDVTTAIVRILDAGRRPVGVGCLVRERLVVTCAHVVADALGLPRGTGEAPSAPIRLDFPFIEGSERSARVIVWWAYRDEVGEHRRHDLALLELPDTPGEAEPARLLKPGHERSGPICAYGFPKRAALGALGDWVEGRLTPPLPNGWLKLLRRQEGERFIEPGCSGGPVVIEDPGIVAGIVSLRRKDPPEAYGIAASVIREALREATSPTGATSSTGQPQGEIRATIARLLEAARNLQLDRNATGQMAQEIIAISELMQHCVEGDLAPERLAALATANEDLADFALRAKRGELDRFFEDAPLRGIVDRLDELTSRVPTALVSAGEIPVDYTENERADIKSILGLRREVEAAQAALARDHVILDGSRRETAWRGLQELKILLTKPRLSLRRLNEARARLEAIKANLLERTARLTRVVLGHYATLLPAGAVFQDREDTPELVLIPAGRFLMGSAEDEEDRDDDEGPQHEVRIGQRFALGRYPVTFEEYDRFADATGRERPGDEDWGRGRRPVINVSWEDAQAYVTWLSAETGRTYRLPSEAEWEYACRAETTSRYWWGDDITTENANYDGRVGTTTEVGSYPANPWGLYDPHGNVWERVKDCWNSNYDDAPKDGRAWLSGECNRRVVRGGSWYNRPENLRSANRNANAIKLQNYYLGFRVARTLITP
jgi:formylglycine-generating enzyme required for sulfatase activity